MIRKNNIIIAFILFSMCFGSTGFVSNHLMRPPEDLPLKVLWKFNLESNSTLPIPVFDKGTIYIYNNQGKLYALDPKKGAKIWGSGTKYAEN